MKESLRRVYQFKVTLCRIEPEIWRRIQVPRGYTFWDLHVAIQDAMGWSDAHLHEFEVRDPDTKEKVYIGIPSPKPDLYQLYPRKILKGWRVRIARYITPRNRIALYTYDFGDNWEHKIKLERVVKAEEMKYPVCLTGERACPPEDCGGVWEYYEILKALRNPGRPEYRELLEWVGKYDPERFDPKEVKFDDPRRRLKLMLKLMGYPNE